MGDKLEVDMEGLRTLGTTLTSITDNLNATRSLIDGVRSELGSSEVWDALDDFENDWDDGRGQIDKNMKAMKDIMDEAVQTYDDADAELQKSLTESEESGG